MERCEHRHLADVYDKKDSVDTDGNYSTKENAKPTYQECQDCGAKVKA